MEFVVFDLVYVFSNSKRVLACSHPISAAIWQEEKRSLPMNLNGDVKILINFQYFSRKCDQIRIYSRSHDFTMSDSYRRRFTWWRASREAIHWFFGFCGALSSDFLFDLLVELRLLRSSQLLLSFQLKLLQDQSLMRLLSLLLLVQQERRMEKAERNAKRRVRSYSVNWKFKIGGSLFIAHD